MLTSNSIKNSTIGISLLISAQLCLSLNVIIGKFLSYQITPVLILFLRFGIGSVILCLYLLYKKQFSSSISAILNLNHVNKTSLFTQSLFSGFLYNSLMLTGVKLTSATMAGIFISAEPAIILILSYFILKQDIRSNQLLSIIIVMIGIVSLNLTKIRIEGLNSNLIGDFVVFCAIIPEALYTIIAKKYPVSLPPLFFALGVNLINTVLFGTQLFIFTNDYLLISNLGFFDWTLAASILPCSGFMFFLLWNMGLQFSSAQKAGLITSVVPVGVCLLAVLFLGESIQLYEVLGVCLVILAIYIGSLENKQANNTTIKQPEERVSHT